jgi:hypothetical protein
MKQLLAWTGSADSTTTSEPVMAMAEKFNTGQEVCLQIPSARGVMQVKEGTSGSCASPGLCLLSKRSSHRGAKRGALAARNRGRRGSMRSPVRHFVQ